MPNCGVGRRPFLPDSPGKYIAVFNTRGRVPPATGGARAAGVDAEAAPKSDDTAPGLPVAVAFADLGVTRGALVRDLWWHRDLGVAAGTFAPAIPFHGAGLYRVTPVP